jgi:hypothetical protein
MASAVSFRSFPLQTAFLTFAKSERLLSVMTKEERKAKIAKFNNCFDDLKKKFDGEVGLQVAVELFKTSDAIKGIGTRITRLMIPVKWLIFGFRNQD